MCGAASILLGMIVIIGKDSAMDTFALLFAAYALADGVLSIIAAWPNQAEGMPRLILLEGFISQEGLVSIVAAVFITLWPGGKTQSLPYIIAARAFLTGILEMLAAIELCREIPNGWRFALNGMISIIFGALVILFSDRVGLIKGLIGAFSVGSGILLSAWGLLFANRGFIDR
jgi:uncharacterized membrane protein HdeD (DUF308 family)